jgi:hypothetical protein
MYLSFGHAQLEIEVSRYVYYQSNCYIHFSDRSTFPEIHFTYLWIITTRLNPLSPYLVCGMKK